MSTKIKCLECDTILESHSVHDFVECGCPNGSFLDGGDDYMRMGGVDLSKIKYWDAEKNKFRKLSTRKYTKILDNRIQTKVEELKCSGKCLKHCI